MTEALPVGGEGVGTPLDEVVAELRRVALVDIILHLIHLVKRFTFLRLETNLDYQNKLLAGDLAVTSAAQARDVT